MTRRVMAKLSMLLVVGWQCFAGLYLSFYGLGRISARVTDSLHSFWAMGEWLSS